MSTENTKFRLSKKDKRELSSFHGHELIFDYVDNSLDDERKKSFETFLNENREAQQDLIKTLNGIKYAEQLSETIVSQAVLDSVQEPETYLSVLLKKSKFDQWPQSIKWSIEALIVVCGIVVFLILIPWDKALRLDLSPNQKEIILAEVKKLNQNSLETKEAENIEKPEFIDESVTSKKNPEAKTKIAVKDTAENSEQRNSKEQLKLADSKISVTTSGSNKKSATEKETEELKSNKVSVTPSSVASGSSALANNAQNSAQKVATAEKTSEEKISKANSGSLFRGVLYVTNAQAVSPKITEKIQSIGGRKAGEVDLGWKKSENTYYYHFTIPEAKYEELKTFMAGYAKFELKKENHPRVMPDGIIRLIIQVEEKSP